MRLITDTVPSGMAGTAQTVYGLVGVGGATAVLMIVSGWLYSRFGPAGFWAMALDLTSRLLKPADVIRPRRLRRPIPYGGLLVRQTFHEEPVMRPVCWLAGPVA